MEDVRKLLDNGWFVLVFRDGLGSYRALAVRDGGSIDAAFAAWAEYEPNDEKKTPAEWVFDGPNRLCGCGLTVAEALAAATEKVLFGRLPERPARHPCASAHHGCTGTVATPGALCEACECGI